MADFQTLPRITSHVRSISLPSELHPLDSKVEDLLHRLRSNDSKPSSSSSSSITNNLCDIKDLYETINNFISCPLNQQVLSLELNRHGVEKVLEGSLELLDAVGSTMDLLSTMKESILDLQSSLRRRHEGDSGLEKDISSYFISRKKITKMVSKCLKGLNKVDLNKEVNFVPAVRTLREAESVSLSTLKCILGYFCGSNSSKGKGWSLVSKLVHSKKCISHERKVVDNDMQDIDEALLAFGAKKSMAEMKTVQNLVKKLEKIEVNIHEIQDCLELVSRCLLRTRVSLLNILTY